MDTNEHEFSAALLPRVFKFSLGRGDPGNSISGPPSHIGIWVGKSVRKEGQRWKGSGAKAGESLQRCKVNQCVWIRLREPVGQSWDTKVGFESQRTESFSASFHHKYVRAFQVVHQRGNQGLCVCSHLANELHFETVGREIGVSEDLAHRCSCRRPDVRERKECVKSFVRRFGVLRADFKLVNCRSGRFAKSREGLCCMHCLVTSRIGDKQCSEPSSNEPLRELGRILPEGRFPFGSLIITPSQQEWECVCAYLLNRELCFVALLWGVSTWVAPTTVALDPVRKPVTASRWLVLSGKENQRCRHDCAAEREQKCPTPSHSGSLAGNVWEGKPR
jgi:hypothetical protein